MNKFINGILYANKEVKMKIRQIMNPEEAIVKKLKNKAKDAILIGSCINFCKETKQIHIYFSEKKDSFYVVYLDEDDIWRMFRLREHRIESGSNNIYCTEQMQGIVKLIQTLVTANNEREELKELTEEGVKKEDKKDNRL